jgi:hypothetical protein
VTINIFFMRASPVVRGVRLAVSAGDAPNVSAAAAADSFIKERRLIMAKLPAWWWGMARRITIEGE